MMCLLGCIKILLKATPGEFLPDACLLFHKTFAYKDKSFFRKDK